MTYHIGIDLGGTKIEIVILNSKLKVIYRDRIPTESEKGFEVVLKNIKEIYFKALKYIKKDEFTLGIGSPGSVNKDSGLIQNSTIHHHNGKDIKKIFENELNTNLILENDANCFTLAEAILGVAKNYKNVFGIILGTGCGGGIVFNKKLWVGQNFLAGEWGHSIIDINGNKCFCGNNGCINTFISGTAIENKLIKISGNKISAKDFFQKSNYDDEERDILDEFYNVLEKSLNNLIKILDPEVFVLGGGLSNYDLIYKKIQKSSYISTPFLKNSLGDSAGVIGAALLGRDLVF